MSEIQAWEVLLWIGLVLITIGNVGLVIVHRKIAKRVKGDLNKIYGRD